MDGRWVHGAIMFYPSENWRNGKEYLLLNKNFGLHGQAKKAITTNLII
jgi:hypothetical protein